MKQNNEVIHPLLAGFAILALCLITGYIQSLNF